MKEVIAIIRPKNVESTKKALDVLGFSSITAVSVLGRGKQRGIAGEVGCDIPPDRLPPESAVEMKYVPKRMVSLVVRDGDVDQVVKTIIKINQSSQVGDGKIFTCPIENAVRVRTDEEGENAIS
jgi:nitrogen regulatory protein PII 2